MGMPAVYRGGATNQFGVYRGGATTHNADFLGDLLGVSREVDREMGPVDEAINEGIDKAEGVGKEVLGINDAERSKEEFEKGNIIGGLFYGALATPFGKWGKGAKEAGEEVVEEAGEQLAKQAVKGISDERSWEIAQRARERGVPVVNGKYAGANHPVTGVPFRDSGFPDFTQYADDAAKTLGKPTTHEVEGITGRRYLDEKLANAAAGFERTPKGYTWHHVEDCRHMQLVPTKVHKPTTHSGCVQLIKHGIVDPGG